MPEKITGGIVQVGLYIAAGLAALSAAINIAVGKNPFEPLVQSLLFVIVLYVADEHD